MENCSEINQSFSYVLSRILLIFLLTFSLIFLETFKIGVAYKDLFIKSVQILT